ncbi:MAG TPA: M20/M25/M40 family metallo-hydrolase, partial [Phycisphaerales bacterium]|nr:M20/M25/M40 family metallo-hydrolase [Phycisphaerales bacterium]
MNIDLLHKLCETPGIPGREERVRAFIQKSARDLFDDIRTDALGSLICTRKPTAKGSARSNKMAKPTRVMLAAHMDEIGFYIRHVDDQGFLWLNPAGGFDPRNLFSRRVLVCTDNGDYQGVMNPGGKPIHISTPEDRKKVPELNEFFIDLGMRAEDVLKNVKIGDFVVMHEPFLNLPTCVISKALDNRIACFVALEAVRELHRAKTKHSCEVVVAFTTQEEVGLRGAMTAAHSVNADLGVGLDVTLACDTPGVPDNQRVSKHGDGCALLMQDSSMIADHELVRDMEAIAKRHKIAVQRSILPLGGQDGAAIQRSHSGVRTTALCVGTRYIHTVTESANKKDLQ